MARSVRSALNRRIYERRDFGLADGFQFNPIEQIIGYQREEISMPARARSNGLLRPLRLHSAQPAGAYYPERLQPSLHLRLRPGRQHDHAARQSFGRRDQRSFEHLRRLNRPTYWEQTRGGGLWFGRSHYQYDKVGREAATWREEEGNRGEWFRYSPTNQITDARYDAEQVWTANPLNAIKTDSYVYTQDNLNRASLTRNGVTTTYGVSALNQYTTATGTTVEYDIRFNLYRMNGWQYNHDAPNRLVSVTGNGHSASFTYDGLGRCVRRIVDGQTTLFVYDGWKPVTEYDAAGNLYARNIYGPGPDEILMRGSPSGWFFYHADKQGSVSALVDLSGNVAERYKYDAFGQPTITDWQGNPRLDPSGKPVSGVGNRFMFTGREYLAPLGLYDYRHRQYLPSIGRFLQTDPTGFDGGDMNLFRYCADDPVNRIDPMGLYGEEIPNFEEAMDVARSRVLAEVRNPNRPTAIAEFGTRGTPTYLRRVYTPGISVSVVPAKSGNYELSELMYGTVQKIGNDYYDVEPVANGGKPAHSHNDTNSGLGRRGWSRLDRKLPDVDRMDESKPGVWYSRRKGKEVASDRASREQANRKSRAADRSSSNPGTGSSVDKSSAPSAAEVDAAHQATGVPSQAAEAVNFVQGPR